MEELQEMREQLALLKQKLDKETIVNDRLLREVTRQKVNRLNRNVWQEGVACSLVITFGSYAFYHMGLSWWFIGATIIMMVSCFLLTLIPHRRVKIDEIMSGDLLTVSKQIRQLKSLYQNWIKYGAAIALAWMTWFGIEVWHTSDDWRLKLVLLVGCFVGGFVGGLIGWTHQKKLQQEMDDIIQQIEM